MVNVTRLIKKDLFLRDPLSLVSLQLEALGINHRVTNELPTSYQQATHQ